jgi:hypothetical protein
MAVITCGLQASIAPHADLLKALITMLSVNICGCVVACLDDALLLWWLPC